MPSASLSSRGQPGTAWQDLTAAIVQAAGFDVEDFSVTAAGPMQLVRVMVDSDDGLSLDDAAALSRDLAAAYDAADAAAPTQPITGHGPYTLEVTSCGIGRPLRLPRHFRRATGRLVAITTGGATVRGRVLGITETGVDILTGKKGLEQRSFPFAEIDTCVVEVEFNKPSPAQLAALAADPRGAAAAARLTASADPDADQE